MNSLLVSQKLSSAATLLSIRDVIHYCNKVGKLKGNVSNKTRMHLFNQSKSNNTTLIKITKDDGQTQSMPHFWET